MEGGDTWAFDSQTSLHDLFNISGTTDGNSDLSNISGENIFATMNWSYTGTNSYIDHLEPLGNAFTAFRNPDAGRTRRHCEIGCRYPGDWKDSYGGSSCNGLLR